MKTDTSSEIIAIIKKRGQVRPHDLIKELKLSRVAIHKQLKKLINEKKIIKQGKPPLVFYGFDNTWPEVNFNSNSKLNDREIKVIEDNFLYVDFSGRLRYGLDGLLGYYIHASDHIQSYDEFGRDYVKIRKQFCSQAHRVDLTPRLNKYFKTNYLAGVYCVDYYSLPKFAKTKLSQLVFYAKQTQSQDLMNELVEKTLPVLEKLIQDFRIEATAFIPHSLPRKQSFIKLFQQELSLSIPNIELVKIHDHDLPIAQRNLFTIGERVKNAADTIIIKPPLKSYQTVLLIDDVIDSGATLHEATRKLKEKGVKKVYGFAIVGSMRGFEMMSKKV